jgi:hypothetical protein
MDEDIPKPKEKVFMDDNQNPQENTYPGTSIVFWDEFKKGLPEILIKLAFLFLCIWLIVPISSIAIAVINDLSDFTDNIGLLITTWFKSASLYPGSGFRNLVRLVLTAGTVCLALIFIIKLKR